MNEDKGKKESRTLEELTRELKAIGYQKHQIKDIISEASNHKDLAKLTAEEEEQVREHLLNYLEFAKRCWRKTNQN